MKKGTLLFLAIVFIVVLMGCTDKEYEKAMTKAEEFIKEEKYEAAIGFLDTALEEKKEDAKAFIYLEQTEDLMKGIDGFDEGEIEKAKKSFEEVVSVENGSNDLEDKAEKQLDEIEHLESVYKDANQFFREADELGENEEYEEALSITDEALELDLSHTYTEDVKNDLESLRSDLESHKKKAEEARKEEREKKEKEAKAKKEAEKKQELINQVQGYWSNLENDINICQFTDDYYICATAASDHYYYDMIESWDANIDGQTITLQTDDGGKTTLDVPKDNTLALQDGNYRQVTKEEADDIVGEFGVDVEDMFDIEQYRQWDE